MHPELNALCRRLEFAQASQNLAAAAVEGEIFRSPGALGAFFGPAHPMNQGLALGLGGPLSAGDLDRLEGFLGRDGGTVVVELSPGADPDLAALLARRGYRIRQFQQVWMRGLEHLPAESCADVRPIRPGEAGLAARVIAAGFLDRDDPEGVDRASVMPVTAAEGTTVFLAFAEGRPVGGGLVGMEGESAALSGTSVLPGFRGRGLQRALILARLRLAAERGGTLACSATLPGTASQANLERCGFRAAYPKLELARDHLP